MSIKTAKTIGILGGGQLGRMSAMAAARLGIKTHTYCTEENAPASHISARTFTGTYDDFEKLQAFIDTVDVVSYEFENIPVETVQHIENQKPVYPDSSLLKVTQHRGSEKRFLNDTGIETAHWAVVDSPDKLSQTLNDLGCSEYILKTTRFGYDGKGQAQCSPDNSAMDKWQELNSNEIIVEEKLDFAYEISVIIARDKDGKNATYGPVRNEHKNGILDTSTVPADMPGDLAQKACDITTKLAESIDLRGVLTLEMFVTKDGRILANEIAPRTHNSGHWTIDACAVSQFENHVRAVCGLPVGDPARFADAQMINLIGHDADNAARYLEQPGACLHLYGKDQVKPGRKMGHVTILKPLSG